MSFFFTSESVSEGHPDKIADQISDAILDDFLAFDKNARVGIETLVTTNQVILTGEVFSKAKINIKKTIRETIKKIGYTKNEYNFNSKSCNILSYIHKQSPDIYKGIIKKKKKNQGAGDQGIIFGYATKETNNYIPFSLELCNLILKELSKIRKKNNFINYLRPDSKAQVTLEYTNEKKIKNINTIVISTQHDNFSSEKKMQKHISEYIKKKLIPKIKKKLPKKFNKLFTNKIKYYINPTGNFVIGGPHADSGITGRKIIVDTYGGKGSHGGGAFSGKDPSKLDRSGAYAARYIAKNLVASGLVEEILIQISYAIGISKPISIYVNSYGTCKKNITDNTIAKKILKIFDLRPYSIEKYLKLRNPIYKETASYGHMGRKPKKIKKIFFNSKGQKKEIKVELFTWEKLDLIPLIKKTFIF